MGIRERLLKLESRGGSYSADSRPMSPAQVLHRMGYVLEEMEDALARAAEHGEPVPEEEWEALEGEWEALEERSKEIQEGYRAGDERWQEYIREHRPDLVGIDQAGEVRRHLETLEGESLEY